MSSSRTEIFILVPHPGRNFSFTLQCSLAHVPLSPRHSSINPYLIHAFIRQTDRETDSQRQADNDVISGSTSYSEEIHVHGLGVYPTKVNLSSK